MLFQNQSNLPYYAVIFTSKKSKNIAGYNAISDKMVALVKQQKGFLGFDSAYEKIGITVSYWKNKETILAWKQNVDHQIAQKNGIEKWYESYTIRICKVESAYQFTA